MGSGFQPIGKVCRAISLAAEYRVRFEATEYNRDYMRHRLSCRIRPGRGVKDAKDGVNLLHSVLTGGRVKLHESENARKKESGRR
jgi:hypothetical protein